MTLKGAGVTIPGL